MPAKKKKKPLFGRDGLTRGMTFQEVKTVSYQEFKSALNFSSRRLEKN